MKLYKKKRGKNRQRKCDSNKNSDNSNDDKNIKKGKSEKCTEIFNNCGRKSKNKNVNQENHLENYLTEIVGNNRTSNEKKNEYYIYEELKLKKDIKNSICFFTWFYYYENIKLNLDNFLSSFLNYSYYLLNNTNNSKRNMLLINSQYSAEIKKKYDSSYFTLNFNNCSYEIIEQIIMNKKEIIDKIEGKELNIIKFLKKKNIKNMIYINDFFEPDHTSILFLINSTDEKENINSHERNFIEKEFMDDKLSESCYNECAIMKGYDIILLRYSFEVFYFYKEKDKHQNESFLQYNDTNSMESTKKYIKNDLKKNNEERDNELEKESINEEKIILEKNKFHTMLTWKRYLKDIYVLKENVVLDALSICSGMDGYIDDKNFNFDVLLNDEYSYLVQYKTKISICRLIYAVTSLLKKKIKPIIYIPHWWYHEIQVCKINIVESPEFHSYIFNELKKDGLLKVGYKQINSLIFTMNGEDIDFFISLAMKNDAILCTNNNDIIKYYFSINENAKVSKFISKGTFFVLTNFL